MMHWERLDDAGLLDEAVREFARATRFPLVFGGFHVDGVATVASLAGNRTRSLMHLEVATGRGLGGKAVAECRPRLATDYARSSQITHDYDHQVLSEGVVTLFAFPVVVSGRARAVLYGGSRSNAMPGEALPNQAAAVANAFGQELRVRDEVRRRILSFDGMRERPSTLPAPELEELRESYAELRSIASHVESPELRARIAGVEQRLARLSGTTPSGEAGVGADAQERAVKLAPREVDVLSYVALGSSNAETGRALGLTEGTVKSYLKSACSKLGCSNRHAAVSAARRAGLIP